MLPVFSTKTMYTYYIALRMQGNTGVRIQLFPGRMSATGGMWAVLWIRSAWKQECRQRRPV